METVIQVLLYVLGAVVILIGCAIVAAPSRRKAPVPPPLEE